MRYERLENNIPYINNLLDYCRKRAAEIAVLFIANRKQHISKSESNIRLKLRERASSDEKIDLIIRRIQEFGAKVYLFDSDEIFMKEILNQKKYNVSEGIRIVYQNGLSGSGIISRCLISAFCEKYQLPIMNSPSSARAIVWNKYNFSILLGALGVPVPQTWLYDAHKGWVGDEHPHLGQLVIAKLNYEALAFGIDEHSTFEYEKSADFRLKAQSISLDQPIIVQEFIPGQEIYITVIKSDKIFLSKPVLLSIEGKMLDGFDYLTFNKNRGNFAVEFEEFRPKNRHISDRMLDVAGRAFELIGLSGLGRFDFRLTNTGRFFLFDVAEVPSLSEYHATSRSLVASGLSNNDIIPTILSCNLIEKGLI